MNSSEKNMNWLRINWLKMNSSQGLNLQLNFRSMGGEPLRGILCCAQVSLLDIWRLCFQIHGGGIPLFFLAVFFDLEPSVVVCCLLSDGGVAAAGESSVFS